MLQLSPSLSLLLPLSLRLLQPLSVRGHGHGRVREHEERADDPPHPGEHQHVQRLLVRALQYIQRKA